MADTAPEAITLEKLRTLDLDVLRNEIEAKKTQLAEGQKELDGMIAIMKAVSIMQHGKPPRKPRGSSKPKSPKPFSDIEQVSVNRDGLSQMPVVTPRKGPKPDREKIADLLRSQGAMQVHQIAARLALAESRVNLLLSGDSDFEMNPANGRWSVTS